MSFPEYFPVFNKLTPNEQELLLKKAVLCNIKKGEVVTRMLKYIQSEGIVKLTRGTNLISDKKAKTF